MLKKSLRQNVFLLLCISISAWLPVTSDFWSPLPAQIDGASDVVFNLDQGDPDDSLIQARSTDVFPSKLTRHSALQATGCFRSRIGLQFARGPPIFS